MNILENKIKEIADIITENNNSEYIKQILEIAKLNYFENDVEELTDKYNIRDYININQLGYNKLILPCKNGILKNREFDYKVFIILKLLANNKQNNVITKFMLHFNKEKILKEYNISEKEFLKGFNNLLSLGIIKEEDNQYIITIKKQEGYYILLDRDICKVLVKENSRTIKTYIFMRDYLLKNADLKIDENLKGIINNNIMNYATGYKDQKSLKTVIERLIDLELIERTMTRKGYNIIYTYEIYKSKLDDCLIM